MKIHGIAALACFALGLPAYALDVEEVRFTSGELELYAEIHLPDVGDELPGVALIQGSGASGTGNHWARMIANAFAECGYAVLLPDKRGVGRSAGTWQTAGFEELAEDAVASLRALEAHPRVAAGRVGLMGLSQGGHVAPLAALSVPGIPFVVDVVGSLTVMEEQLQHELANTYRQHGLDVQTVDYLQTLTELSFAYLRDESRWEDYLARRAEIAAGPWSRAADSWPDTRHDAYWVFWRKIYDYDPLPHWHELAVERNVPALVLLGGQDEHDNVPVRASVLRAKALAADEDFTIRVYEDSGHALFEPGTPTLRRDMIEETDRWLRAALERR